MVFQVQQEPNAVRIALSSTSRLLDKAIASILSFLKEQGFTQTLDVKLVLRELGNNAIRHGNQNDPERLVTIRVTIDGEDGVRAEVGDEGTGFNYRALELDLPTQFHQIRDRGYKIIHALAQRLEFNETGNQVTVWVAVVQEPKAGAG